MDRQDPRVVFAPYRDFTIEAGAYRLDAAWHPEYRVLRSLETVIHMQRSDMLDCESHQAGVEAAVELAKSHIDSLLLTHTA
jgi:hypothetical protein